MLKRFGARKSKRKKAQPPSGGCVLKHALQDLATAKQYQPPSGGCVLKQYIAGYNLRLMLQPPSGGCVLKLLKRTKQN